MSDEPPISDTSTSGTSTFGGLALTEHTATPTPPKEKAQGETKCSPPCWDVPDTFVLPNGYPDVRNMAIALPSAGSLIAYSVN